MAPKPGKLRDREMEKTIMASATPFPPPDFPIDGGTASLNSNSRKNTGETSEKSKILFCFGLMNNFEGHLNLPTNCFGELAIVRHKLMEMLTFFNVAVTRITAMKGKGGGFFAFINCHELSDAQRCMEECTGISFGGGCCRFNYKQAKKSDSETWNTVLNRKEIERRRGLTKPMRIAFTPPAKVGLKKSGSPKSTSPKGRKRKGQRKPDGSKD